MHMRNGTYMLLVRFSLPSRFSFMLTHYKLLGLFAYLVYGMKKIELELFDYPGLLHFFLDFFQQLIVGFAFY
jgi:hypothetical protein